MKHNDKLHEEVEKTLQSLDGIERAETDAFFYSRLSSKLEHCNQPELHAQPFQNFAFAFSVALLLLTMSLNLMFISNYRQAETELEATYAQERLMEEMSYDYQAFNIGYYEEFETTEE